MLGHTLGSRGKRRAAVVYDLVAARADYDRATRRVVWEYGRRGRVAEASEAWFSSAWVTYQLALLDARARDLTGHERVLRRLLGRATVSGTRGRSAGRSPGS